MDFDVFISHASEDKVSFVRPLAEALKSHGLRVWFDETELKLGDSLRRSIDLGLARSRYGVVVLSPDFLAKEWPQKELDGLVAREDGDSKVILPLWHNVTRLDISQYSPTLADKLAAPTSKGLDYVVNEVLRAIGKESETGPSAQGVKSVPKEETQDFSALLFELMDEVMDLADNADTTITGISTGFRDLDLFTSGLQPGALSILAGYPTSGRTSFALNVVDNVACNERLPVLFFSLNESAQDLTKRLVCSAGRVEAHHLRVGRLTEPEWPSLVEGIDRLRHASLFIHDAPAANIDSIVSTSERYRNMLGAVGLIVVDSLELIESTYSPEGRLHDPIQLLKNTARQLNCPVLLIAEARRNMGRSDPRPMLSDIEKADTLDRVADLILLLYRSIPHRPEEGPEIVELVIAKQKSGSPTGMLRLGFLSSFGRFENVAPESSARRGK